MAKRAARRKHQKQKQPKTFNTESTGIGRPFMFVVLGGLLLAGIITRVYYLDRSLWLDEAWVANSIQSASLREAIYYDDWLQTTPPLFIALSRLITALFGTSNVAFRALPAFAGIVSILLFAFIALRLLKPSYALSAILLFVLSPRLILYSQSLKQYSTDVLSTLGLMAIGVNYMEKPTDRSFYVLTAGFVALSFLSYPVMLFLPFLLHAAFTRVDLPPGMGATQRTIRFSGLRLLVVIVAGLFVGATNYWFFIQPNRSPTLTGFFPEGFYQGSDLNKFLEFYGTRFLTLAGPLFFGGHSAWRIVAAVLIVIGLVYLWTSQLTSRGIKGSGTAILLTVPLAGAIALNLIGFFPLPGFDHRLLLFVFPTTVLAFALGLECFVNLLARLIASQVKNFKTAAVENITGSVGFMALVALVLLFFNSVGLEPYFAEEQEDSEQAVSYLTQRVQSNDVVYIHASMREQFKLYNRAMPVTASSTIYGKIGMPCCPRKDYRSPSQETVTDIAGEIFALVEASIGRSLWLLITDRPLHWFHIRRNDIQIFERGLARQSCEKMDEAKFTGVYVARFGCKPK